MLAPLAIAAAGCSGGSGDDPGAAGDLAAPTARELGLRDLRAPDGGGKIEADLAAPDLAQEEVDLAVPDLAQEEVDLAAEQVDLRGVKPPDLSGVKPPDLSGVKPPDLAGVKPPDLAGMKPPDLAGVKPPDLAGMTPPDLAAPKPDLAAPKPDGGSGGGPMIGNCPILPADNELNRDISNDPIDPNSATYLARMNAGVKNLHPDFGSTPTYGIPWITVPGNQPKVPMKFLYAGDSDPGPYPFPPNAPIEGGANSMLDRHVLVMDRDNCILYEAVYCFYVNPGWTADAGAIFDLRSNKLRPNYWTSSDAAGLPVMPLLVKRNEVLAGEFKHAIRFAVAKTQRAFVHPATHFASNIVDPSYPPMGLRVRLKASFDVSKYGAQARTILVAMKRFGMILSDNGSDWYFGGEQNVLWDDNEIHQLKNVPASAFEVVKLGQIYK